MLSAIRFTDALVAGARGRPTSHITAGQGPRWQLEFLRWFFIYADFGPADGDVRDHMYRLFTKRKGKALPEGYAEEE